MLNLDPQRTGFEHLQATGSGPALTEEILNFA